MKGDAAMVQTIVQLLIMGLLTALVGIIWFIVRDIFEVDHCPSEAGLAKTSAPEPYNEEELHEPSSQQSKIAV